MIKKIVVLVIIVWFLISLFRIFYNSYRIFTDSDKINYLSDTQKREKLFSCFDISREIKRKITKGKVALITNDGFCYFTLRYYLYPILVYLNPKDMSYDERKYNLIVKFNSGSVIFY